MVDTTSVKGILTLLRGEPQCADRSRLVGLMPAQLLADGLTRLCIVPIPPAYGKVLGAILLAWRKQDDSEGAAVAAATEAAGSMVSR